MERLALLLDKSGSKANQSVNAKSQDQFIVQSRNMDLFPYFPRSDDQDELLNWLSLATRNKWLLELKILQAMIWMEVLDQKSRQASMIYCKSVPANQQAI